MSKRERIVLACGGILWLAFMVNFFIEYFKYN
jgi:hypothetical protein